MTSDDSNTSAFDQLLYAIVETIGYAITHPGEVRSIYFRDPADPDVSEIVLRVAIEAKTVDELRQMAAAEKSKGIKTHD